MLSILGDGPGLRGPWSPKSLPGIEFWSDANVGVTLSGSNVTGWADQSGLGNNVTDTTGVPPTFSATALNGKPGIVFSGATSQTLGNGTVNLVTAGGARYLFIVAKPNGADSTSGGFPFSFRRNTDMFAAILGWIGQDFVFFDGVNPTTITHTPGQQAIVGEWSSSGAGPNTLQVVINGATVLGLNSTAVASDTGATGFDVGSCQYNTGTSFVGPISEVIAGSGTLSAANIALTRRYLAAKWLIPANQVFNDSVAAYNKPINTSGSVWTYMAAPSCNGELRISVPSGTTSLIVGLYRDLDSVSAGVDGTTAVYVDGVYNTGWLTAGLGGDTKTLSLDGNPHIVELWTAFQQNGPTGQYITSISGTGISLSSTPPSTSARLVFYGDSITAGAKSSVIATKSYAGIIRSAFPGRVTTVAFGGRSLSQDVGVGTAAIANGYGSVAATAAALVAACQEGGATNKTLWIQMGVNDYLNADLSPTNWATQMGSLIDSVHAIDPAIAIYLMSIFTTGQESTAIGGFLPSDFRTAASGLTSGRAWLHFVNGTAMLPGAGLSGDNIHPNDTGHADIATNIRGVLGF